MLLACPKGDIYGDTRDMEFKDHGGPVYALHLVFTLNDVDWPNVDASSDEPDENGDTTLAQASRTLPAS